MRIPCNQFYHPVRDERKHIMFIGDIFDSKKDAALIPVMKLLDKEYCCMHVELLRNPSQTLISIKCSCLSDVHKPDLIVAYGSGATLAAQVEGIEKVLIKPYYSTSNMLAGILGETRINVSRVLNGFQQQGLVELRRKEIVVPSLRKLRQHVESCG